MTLSPKFEQALDYALIIHAGQVRKETDIPFAAHLLGVVSIALEHGATEDEAIGALLHDAGEDAGGSERILDIRQRFGDAVADIVEGCTDTVEQPKPAWKQRKVDYIERIARESLSIRLVSASDKLHNVRAILRDYRTHGDKLWSRFNGGKDGSLWYYRELVTAFRVSALAPGDRSTAYAELIDELDVTLAELERTADTR